MTKKKSTEETFEAEGLAAEVLLGEEPPVEPETEAEVPASDDSHDEFTDEYGRRWRRVHEERAPGVWIDKTIRVG